MSELDILDRRHLLPTQFYGHTGDPLLDTDEGDLWLFAHTSAMTGEGLHSKADIAAELAWRDAYIQQLKKLIADTLA